MSVSLSVSCATACLVINWPKNASAAPTSAMCCAELAKSVDFAVLAKSQVRVSAVGLFVIWIIGHLSPSFRCGKTER
jgi:hypothetical protein